MAKKNDKSMDIYVIVENSCEYNDNDYDVSNVGEPIRAYRSKENADKECVTMNGEKRGEGKRISRDSSNGVDFFKVVKLTVSDDDVSTYKKTKEDIKKLKEKAKEASQDVLKAAVADVFEEYPKLESFSWTQYTDYFNDGDTCRFHTHFEYRADVKYDGKEFEINGHESDEKIDKCTNSIQEALSHIETEDYLSMFGDHVRVTVTRDSIDTEDYSSHD